jgi:hypothetical protein
MSALVSDILDKAADLIEPEGRWTQEAFSRTKSGHCNAALVAPRKPSCWCALGAIAAVAGHDPSKPFTTNKLANEAVLILDSVVMDDGIYDTPDYNDATGRTQAEVVAKLREAAALARGQGK